MKARAARQRVQRHHLFANAQGLSLSGGHPLPGNGLDWFTRKVPAWRISNTPSGRVLP